MISTYQLKTRFQALLRPAASCLHGIGATANQITVGACLISIGLGAMAMTEVHRKLLFLFIALWCLGRMAANALDGMLAREYGQASRLGAVLNEAGDIISDVALYLPFAWITGAPSWWVIVILWLAVCSEAVGWLGARLRRECGNHGPMGKSDRALVFGVIALLYAAGVPIAPYLEPVWWVVTALLCMTLYNRARHLAGG